MSPINSNGSSDRAKRVNERNQKRRALLDVTNSKEQEDPKRTKHAADTHAENGSSENSTNGNELDNAPNSALFQNVTNGLNGPNVNIEALVAKLVAAQYAELHKQLNSTVGTSDVDENNNQTKDSASMAIFDILAAGGNSNDNQNKSLALIDEQSIDESQLAAPSSGPIQLENDILPDVNLPTFLDRVIKVKKEDAKYGIVHRFYVKLCEFDFCGAANSPLNITKFNALNGFKEWADAAETSKYSLALLISSASVLARNYSTVITNNQQVAPYFDTTQLHGFCAVASSNFPELVRRYQHLVNVWYNSKKGTEVSTEDQQAIVFHPRGNKGADEDDDNEAIDKDGNLIFPFNELLYTRMYRCLDTMKSKWRKNSKKMNPMKTQ